MNRKTWRAVATAAGLLIVAGVGPKLPGPAAAWLDRSGIAVGGGLAGLAAGAIIAIGVVPFVAFRGRAQRLRRAVPLASDGRLADAARLARAGAPIPRIARETGLSQDAVRMLIACRQAGRCASGRDCASARARASASPALFARAVRRLLPLVQRNQKAHSSRRIAVMRLGPGRRRDPRILA
ncbi:MAG: hypothetical protein ACE15D_10600 [Candidatus Eisenbacteria bacterium]